MARLPDAMAERIAKSQPGGGGNNMRHGIYTLMVKDVIYKPKSNVIGSADCVIPEFIVVTCKPLTVYENGIAKTEIPNEVGSTCHTIIKFGGPGEMSADGNLKAFVMGLFGCDSKTPEAELKSTMCDITDDSQPARGLLVNLETWAKPVRSKPGNYITGLKWINYAKPGEGENTMEKAKERYAATLPKAA